MFKKVLYTTLFVLFLSFFAWAQTKEPERIVNDKESAKICVDNAKSALSQLGIKIDRDILIRVEKLEDLKMEYARTSPGYNVFAFYNAHSPEALWLPKGYKVSTLTPFVAHELVHAWQTTNCPLQPHAIHEGFAQWAGMKTCEITNRTDLIRHFLIYGDDDKATKMIQYFIQLEKKGGYKAVLDYAKTATKLPREVL